MTMATWPVWAISGRVRDPGKNDIALILRLVIRPGRAVRAELRERRTASLTVVLHFSLAAVLAQELGGSIHFGWPRWCDGGRQPWPRI